MLPNVYRLFFFDADGKQLATDKMISDSEVAAIEAAKQRAEFREGCHGFEVWISNRLVYAAKR